MATADSSSAACSLPLKDLRARLFVDQQPPTPAFVTDTVTVVGLIPYGRQCFTCRKPVAVDELHVIARVSHPTRLGGEWASVRCFHLACIGDLSRRRRQGRGRGGVYDVRDVVTVTPGGASHL